MNYEFCAPVQGIANAFRRGIVLAERICKFAQNAPATHMLDTLQPAQTLAQSLARSELRIKNAYAQSMKAFGRRYEDAVIVDHTTADRLHALAANVLEQINGLDEYIYDPMAFDLGSFPYLQRESERCCEQTINALGSLHERLLQAGLQQYQISQNNMTSSSIRRVPVPTSRVVSEMSPMTANPPTGLGIQMVAEEHRTDRISSPPRQGPPSYEANLQTGTSYGHFQGETRRVYLPAAKQSSFHADSKVDSDVPKPLMLAEVKMKSNSDDPEPKLINREEVFRQMTAIEELLERRRLSRKSFQDEVKQASLQSTSMSPTSARTRSAVSPSIISSPTFSASPIQNSRPNSNLLATITNNLDRQGPPVPPKDIPWDSSAIIEEQDFEKPSRMGSGELRKDSKPVMFGPADSPSLSQGHWPGTDDWGSLGLAPTLNVPSFGMGVVDGIEPVHPVLISDPGLILVNENHKEPAAATSVQSVDYTIRHNSSFYKYGGFCNGAKMMMRGVGGAMKELKKPSGMYINTVSMKCTSCSYEIDYDKYHSDKRLDKAGIIAPPDMNDIRFRSRLLTKCHLKTKQADEKGYACMFCIEENTTLEEQDATVFFSAAQFLSHIRKHPRPLKAVEGIKVVYGPQPESIVDFDLHFITMEARVSPFGDMTAKFASRPKGYAVINHREGAKGFRALNPEGRPTFQFAVGARIVGITYPPRFSGIWCSGYHDSQKAYFPSSAVKLDAPPKGDVCMNPKSFLFAVAKWEHKPKDPNSDWLSFNKKERITHIGYPYEEFWCWSGMNSKGRWGLFPRDFVGGLNDMAGRVEPELIPGSVGTFSNLDQGSGSKREFTFGSLESQSG